MNLRPGIATIAGMGRREHMQKWLARRGRFGLALRDSSEVSVDGASSVFTAGAGASVSLTLRSR